MSAPASILAALKQQQHGIYALCWRVLRHRQDAEDAAQEVLIKAARAWPRLQDPARFLPWLHRITLHAALDARRRRERRIAREDRAGAAPPTASPEDVDRDALHRALVQLEDDERAVVVEHYFKHRTLRQIADAEGCSEPAVWKRVERAKEKLRKNLAALAPGAMPDLDVLLAEAAPAAAPVELVAGRVLEAAAAAGAGSGKAVLLGALVLAGLMGGAALVVRGGGAADEIVPLPPRAASAPTSSAPPRGKAGAVADAPAPAAAKEVERPVRAYPLQLPPSRWPAAKQATWRLLREKRLTIDVQNERMSELLALISRQTGIFLHSDRDLSQERVSFKVGDIVVDGALRLMLQPRGFGYAVLDDGSVHVVPQERLGAYADPEEKRIQQERAALEEASRRMDEGLSGTALHEPTAARLGTQRTDLSGGADSFDGFLERLWKATKINVILDSELPPESLPADWRELRAAEQLVQREEMRAMAGIRDPAQLKAAADRMEERIRALRAATPDRRTLPLAKDATAQECLEQICAAWGFGYRIDEASRCVFVCSRAQAEEAAREAAERRASHAALGARLDRPLAGGAPADVPALVEALSRQGVETIPSEEAWTAAIPEGSYGSWRDLLEALRARGLRWALHEGKLVLLK